MDQRPRLSSWDTSPSSSGDFTVNRIQLEPPEYPRLLQKKLLSLQKEFEANPTNAFAILLDWGIILSKYSKKRLASLTSFDTDYKFKNNNTSTLIQDHIKEALFTACSKFQEGEALSQFLTQKTNDLLRLYFEWGDCLFMLSQYFKLPFFELAVEKYETVLEKMPKYEKPHKVLRKVGIVLAEQAYFSQTTSTTFQVLTQDILQLSEEKFMKSLTLKPKSFKTHIQWAKMIQRNCRICRVFPKVVELSNEIAQHYKTALKQKPHQVAILERWGLHIDWLISFFSSCRRKQEPKLIEVFLDFTNSFRSTAINYYVPLQSLLAFSLLEDPTLVKVTRISHELLDHLSKTSKAKNVREEAVKHLGFLDGINQTKKETENSKLAKAKQIVSQLPPDLKEKWNKSKLTLEEVSAQTELLLNCLYFVGTDPHHPLFAQTHKRAKGCIRTKEPSENLLNTYFKNEDPSITYRDTHLIGSGAFGEVYSASRVDTGALIAMKVFKTTFDGKPDNHIVKEIQGLHQCKNKYLVEFKEAYLWQGRVTVITEFCDGGSLRDMCTEVYLSEREIGFFLQQICEGLRYIHEKNIVHRDLKSDNILLNLNGTIRIADMGLCEPFSSQRKDRLSMVGTSYWMAPEVIAQQHYSYPADVWGLGCVAHELATGNPPYGEPASALASMFWAATRGAPPEIKFRMKSVKQNEPLDWTEVFHSFLDACFHLNPNFRANTSELLSHPLLLNHGNIDMKLKNKLELVFVGRSLKASGFL